MFFFGVELRILILFNKKVMKYTLSEIAAIVGGQLHGRAGDRQIVSVATDSRNRIDAQNGIFVALVGATHDGHRYVGSLVKSGVRSFLVERWDASVSLPSTTDSSSSSTSSTFPTTFEGEVCYIVVPDTMVALQALAAHHRAAYRGTVVAITGSNGKTIVKEWIAQLWDGANGRLFRSPRSYNSQLGVALSLLMIKAEDRVAVIEAGISMPGEMERLERIIRPDIGVITNIGQAHAENFKDSVHKMQEKLLLFAHTPIVIYNADDALLSGFLKGRGVPFSAAGSRDIAAQNRAAALAVYGVMGVSHRNVEVLQDVAMRLELQPGVFGSTIINDSYNSDITALRIALDYQNSQPSAAGGKALILSDIMQSGMDDAELYHHVARLVSDYNIINFIGVGGALCAHSDLFVGGRFYSNTADLLADLRPAEFSGQLVLIKGSRTFGFERLCSSLEQRSHTTTLHVNLGAMARNLNYYRGFLGPGVRTMAMVKAHAYGAGDVEVASMLEHQGVDYLAVAYADEGVTLRQSGHIHLPIIVLNADPGSFDVMIENSLEPEIYSFASLRGYVAQLSRHGLCDQNIHIKLDTGMHRLGFQESDLDELSVLLAELSLSGVVRIASMFSHLSCADDPSQDAFTYSQIALFQRMTDVVAKALGYMPLRHICNSAGIERFTDAHFDMVRLGIGMYGVGDPGLEVVSTLETRIVQIKMLAAGEGIGYGRRTVASREMRIAVLPIGYADGLNRRLGCGAGAVLIGGVRCPIAGNVCMDTCMVDISGCPTAAEGDIVEIFGANLTVSEVAGALGTIAYEVLTSISSRIKRVYSYEL